MVKGNVGDDVGPALFDALAKLEPGRVIVQGVNNYAATVCTSPHHIYIIYRYYIADIWLLGSGVFFWRQHNGSKIHGKYGSTGCYAVSQKQCCALGFQPGSPGHTQIREVYSRSIMEICGRNCIIWGSVKWYIAFLSSREEHLINSYYLKP
jgi:hypothetical protein